MVIWLVILAVMILVEVITMGLTTIWFALGSLGAVVAVATGQGFFVQFAVFVLVFAVAGDLFPNAS